MKQLTVFFLVVIMTELMVLPFLFLSFESYVWTDVPYCVHTSLNSCNVSSIKARSEYGCVMLRVQAERHGQTSPSVQACSTHGKSTTYHVQRALWIPMRALFPLAQCCQPDMLILNGGLCSIQFKCWLEGNIFSGHYK